MIKKILINIFITLICAVFVVNYFVDIRFIIGNLKRKLKHINFVSRRSYIDFDSKLIYNISDKDSKKLYYITGNKNPSLFCGIISILNVLYNSEELFDFLKENSEDKEFCFKIENIIKRYKEKNFDKTELLNIVNFFKDNDIDGLAFKKNGEFNGVRIVAFCNSIFQKIIGYSCNSKEVQNIFPCDYFKILIKGPGFYIPIIPDYNAKLSKYILYYETILSNKENFDKIKHNFYILKNYPKFLLVSYYFENENKLIEFEKTIRFSSCEYELNSIMLGIKLRISGKVVWHATSIVKIDKFYVYFDDDKLVLLRDIPKIITGHYFTIYKKK